jgi:hypothetical protein
MEENMGRGMTRSELERRGQPYTDDEEMLRNPNSGGKIAAFAIAIAIVFGAIFYGLNMEKSPPQTPASQSQQK